MKSIIITIDGPAAAGKTTLAHLLARRLGVRVLNTGLMYRAFAWWIREKGVHLPQEKDMLNHFNLKLSGSNAQTRVLVEGKDITDSLYQNEIDLLSSKLSMIPEVRKRMVELQRLEAQKGSLVAEGRDMGTVVFPDADVKFFLTADEKVRAYRRWKEKTHRGDNIDFELILNEILKRDEQDSKRQIAPLKPAKDAIIIDTTDKTIEDVLDILLFHVSKFLKDSNIKICDNWGGL